MTPKELRKALAREGLSREKFAAEVGVHVTTVYRWLSGEIEMPEKMQNYVKLYFERRAVRA